MSAPAERAKAMAEGRKYYSTGKPCKRGHVANRRTSNSGCVECTAEANRDHRARERVRIWEPREEDLSPKDISLVAFDGPPSAHAASRWLDEQADRLGVLVDFIVGAIRNGWTLIEIEATTRSTLDQLTRHVRTVKDETGFVRSVERWGSTRNGTLEDLEGD